jgi:hypothetical protein
MAVQPFSGSHVAPVALVDTSSSSQSKSKPKKRKADSIELSEDDEGENGPVVFGSAQFKLLMSQLASNQAKTQSEGQ